MVKLILKLSENFTNKFLLTLFVYMVQTLMGLNFQSLVPGFEKKEESSVIYMCQKQNVVP